MTFPRIVVLSRTRAAVWSNTYVYSAAYFFPTLVFSLFQPYNVVQDRVRVQILVQ